LREKADLGPERLFDERVEPDPRRNLMQRVAAFVAPVAADAGSVTDDLVSLDVAGSVAFFVTAPGR
jgi:hypothetical protein